MRNGFFGRIWRITSAFISLAGILYQRDKYKRLKTAISCQRFGGANIFNHFAHLICFDALRLFGILFFLFNVCIFSFLSLFSFSSYSILFFFVFVFVFSMLFFLTYLLTYHRYLSTIIIIIYNTLISFVCVCAYAHTRVHGKDSKK